MFRCNWHKFGEIYHVRFWQSGVQILAKNHGPLEEWTTMDYYESIAIKENIKV
jgi:hypothetical protein